MRIVGTVAEYNPFHKGHEFQINQTKKQGATHIVTVLGSYFTQRGDIALLSKRARCEAAIDCGSDLVIELPLTRTLATAERFAEGGVELLKALGVVDAISFGCECDNKELLIKAADAAKSPLIKASLDKFLSSGMTFAAARQAAVEEVFGKSVTDILSSPNNILATEYIAASKRLGADLDFIPILRKGAAHDSLDTDEFLSATAIRQIYKTDPMSAASSLPQRSGEILMREHKVGNTADLARIENAILCKLKLMPQSNFAAMPDISEGLENRIYTAARTAGSLDELYAVSKSKRYTLARIRRVIISAFLSLDRSLYSSPLPYIRVLGFSQKGAELLRMAKDKASLPILMKPSAASSLGEDAVRLMDMEAKASDMFNMAVSDPQSGYSEYKIQIYKKEK